MIPSLPMFISRAGHITDDAKKGYLYAEMWLYQLEQALEQGLGLFRNYFQRLNNN